MGRIQTRVDHGNGLPRAPESFSPRTAGTRNGDAVNEQRENDTILRNAGHLWIGEQLSERGGIHGHRDIGMESKSFDVPDVQTLNAIEHSCLPGDNSLLSHQVVRADSSLGVLLLSLQSDDDADFGLLFELVGQVGAIAQLVSVTRSPDHSVWLPYGDLSRLSLDGARDSRELVVPRPSSGRP